MVWRGSTLAARWHSATNWQTLPMLFLKPSVYSPIRPKLTKLSPTFKIFCAGAVKLRFIPRGVSPLFVPQNHGRLHLYSTQGGNCACEECDSRQQYSHSRKRLRI